jgi:hypothetical protein
MKKDQLLKTFNVKILPKEIDLDVMLENYWDGFQDIFPNVNKNDFSKWVNEDYFYGWEETLDYNSTGRRELKLLYTTIRAVKPKKILEIGTHIGTGTNHILLALKKNFNEGYESELTSIDVHDFVGDNKLFDFPCKRILEDSIIHLNNNFDYDFIVQDGNHDPIHVKKELEFFHKMKNLKVLWSHDYFTNNKSVGLVFENFEHKIFKKYKTFKEDSYVTGFFLGIK